MRIHSSALVSLPLLQSYTYTYTYAFTPYTGRKYGNGNGNRVELYEKAGGGRSAVDIAEELSSGRRLSSSSNHNSHDENRYSNKDEDVSVMDFANVKSEQSAAELALRDARLRYLESCNHPTSTNSNSNKSSHTISTDNRSSSKIIERLMGINDEVVAEVGHEIGNWAVGRGDDVQACAAMLRQSSNGLFAENEDSSSLRNEEKVAEYRRMLSQAYEESGVVTEAFAKTFYLGTKLMPEEAQRAIWAIYVWCRRTDEIVDAPRPGNEEEANKAMLDDLSAWEIRLERLWEYGEVQDVLDLCLLDTRIKYPTLDIVPFVDMIRGMLMDIPGLGQDRYNSWDELHLYCYRVAGTVGLMSMPVFGCAPGFTEEMAKEPALSLGVAFQITNIVRDVGEDAVKRGRVYLPREDMERFGVTEEQIFEQRIDQNYIDMIKFQIDRARKYYVKAQSGVPMLAPESRLPVQSSLDCYSQILDKIELNGYDNLTKRAYVSKWEKIFTIPFSWYRTLDISKVLPLPGDDTRYVSGSS